MEEKGISKHKIDEGRDEGGNDMINEIEGEELQAKIEEARKRKMARPKIWRPDPGAEKIVKVEKIEERESEYGKTKFFILRDLKEKKLLSLIACGVLLKNLKVGSSYILEYQGKVLATIDGQDREVHSWDWEEVK